MAFDALTGWVSNYTAHAGDVPDLGVATDGADFNITNQERLAQLLNAIIDALDYIAAN